MVKAIIIWNIVIYKFYVRVEIQCHKNVICRRIKIIQKIKILLHLVILNEAPIVIVLFHHLPDDISGSDSDAFLTSLVVLSVHPMCKIL